MVAMIPARYCRGASPAGSTRTLILAGVVQTAVEPRNSQEGPGALSMLTSAVRAPHVFTPLTVCRSRLFASILEPSVTSKKIVEAYGLCAVTNAAGAKSNSGGRPTDELGRRFAARKGVRLAVNGGI